MFAATPSPGSSAATAVRLRDSRLGRRMPASAGWPQGTPRRRAEGSLARFCGGGRLRGVAARGRAGRHARQAEPEPL
eukprot:8835131-Alexandrium_andersonii.AAC.1